MSFTYDVELLGFLKDGLRIFPHTVFNNFEITYLQLNVVKGCRVEEGNLGQNSNFHPMEAFYLIC